MAGVVLLHVNADEGNVELDATCGDVAHSLKDLMHGIGHSMLLENQQGELFLLVSAGCVLLLGVRSSLTPAVGESQVPNHALHRPVVQACPFNTNVVQLRGKHSWDSAMRTRAYVYAVHSSRCYLEPRSFAALLYLVLVRLYARQVPRVHVRVRVLLARASHHCSCHL